LQIQSDTLILGGYDEMIRIFNIPERKEMGGVLENLGSVNFIQSCKSHTLTGSEQGNITIWRNKDWTNLHSFKGHRAGVTGLALHPSSRMLLSSGKDRKIFLWNLIKARASFKCRLDKVIEDIQWSPCGTFFIGKSDREVRVYNVECSLKEEFINFWFKSSIVSVGFLGNSGCFFSADLQGEVNIVAIGKGSLSFNTGDQRLSKAVFLQADSRKLLITASTLGELRIWNLTPAFRAIETLKKNDCLVIENPDDMMVFHTDLNCRVSALVANSLTQ